MEIPVHYMNDVEYVRRNGAPLKIQSVKPGFQRRAGKIFIRRTNYGTV
jgi:hypothetical protein